VFWWRPKIPLGWKSVWTIGALGRFAFFAFWFILLDGQVSGDVDGFAMHANWVLRGEVPNADFSTPYGFYFSYLTAFLVALFGGAAGIVFGIQCLELAGTYLLGRYVSLERGDEVASKLLLLYFSNPLIISWFMFDGQEEAIILLLLVFMMYSLQRWWGGIKYPSSVLMLLLVKPTTLFFVGPYFVGQKIRTWLIFLGLFLILASPALYLHSTVFGLDFSRGGVESDGLSDKVFPGNFWFIIQHLTGFDVGVSIAAPLIVGSLLGVGAYLAIAAQRVPVREVFLLGAAVVTLVYQLTSPYTTPGFLAAIVAPVLALGCFHRELFGKWDRVLFLSWAFFVAVDMPIYYRIIEEIGDAQMPQFILFIALEVLVVLLNLAMLIRLVRHCQHQRTEAQRAVS